MAGHGIEAERRARFPGINRQDWWGKVKSDLFPISWGESDGHEGQIQNVLYLVKVHLMYLIYKSSYIEKI